jgi:hypothetical protein
VRKLPTLSGCCTTGSPEWQWLDEESLAERLRNPIPFRGVRRRSAKLAPLAQNNRAGNGTEDDLFVPFRSG